MFMITHTYGSRIWSCLPGWFWLRVSHEVVVKMSVGVVVKSRLDRAWRICFLGVSLTRL